MKALFSGKRLAYILALLLVIHSAAGQDYQVYGHETLSRGWIELKSWNKMVVQSQNQVEREEGFYSRKGLLLNSLELEYGLTEDLTIGGIVDFINSPHFPPDVYRFRASLRYRLFPKFERIIDPALYIEFYQPAGESQEPAEVETRLILERDIEDFRLILNPTAGMAIAGDAMRDGITASLFGGLYWRRYFLVQPGAEYYGRYGPVTEFKEYNATEAAFAVVRFNLFRGFQWRWGFGAGLTRNEDDFIIKTALKYKFETLRPSEQVW